MTPIDRNKKEEKGFSRGSQPALQNSLIDVHVEDMVRQLLEGIESLLDILEVDERDRTETRVALAKGLVYYGLAFTEADPLFAAPRYGSIFDILKDGLRARIFSGVFHVHPSGREYEYFCCIFDGEYGLISDRLRSLLGRKADFETFDPGREVMRFVEPFLKGRFRDMEENTLALVSGKVKDILTVLQLRMTKAILA